MPESWARVDHAEMDVPAINQFEQHPEFVNWERKVTLSYARLVEICKLSIEYPRKPIGDWVKPEEWNAA